MYYSMKQKFEKELGRELKREEEQLINEMLRKQLEENERGLH
ncbi:hypothetical protein [Alteribacillus iranensis]|uniref:Uncharacterized protein n=1 Tax=Alteribacillus iranensis TaxID=930128 RepID=A0A1I1Z8A5_9BACI|nr:hypothetical protein [Alteribacillus iranensis]SFE27981.1 hypothetical protein SAMN05192532_10197 [Alteribacillus iranensis]